MPEKLSFWESFSSAEKITAFLHHIIIDVGRGEGGGREGGIMGAVYLKDDAYSEKNCGIYKKKDFHNYSLQENLRF